MSSSCNSDCSCCIDGQCKSASSCNQPFYTLIIVGSVIGGCALIMLTFYIVVRCLTRNRTRTNNRVGIQPQSSGRTRMTVGSPNGNGRAGERASAGGQQTPDENSTVKYKIVRAYPEKEIPTTDIYEDLPLEGFKISAKSPIVLLVGGKPTGRPKYLTESVKSLTQSKGRLDNYRGVVLKSNAGQKSSGHVVKRTVIEEVDRNDISNMSLVENAEQELASTKPKKQ